MRWLMSAYVASLNVIAAAGLMALAIASWFAISATGAILVTALCAGLLPLPIYAATINFQSAAELRRRGC